MKSAMQSVFMTTGAVAAGLSIAIISKYKDPGTIRKMVEAKDAKFPIVSYQPLRLFYQLSGALFILFRLPVWTIQALIPGSDSILPSPSEMGLQADANGAVHAWCG
ncbi:alpha/beta hydrolase fold-3 domain-containing protein [Colletotrichum musicola]|uniref:Alpha/beta hydrolase fold-3 domain-containing protein n=1 Tax=Colletotrichum musicola TaxID=2175873 RepID=A0A8H6J3G2_9PEZI|nr:alpha/beta hydrolase fold-3 domain-containing protein [Colletotrichum musicola]